MITYDVIKEADHFAMNSDPFVVCPLLKDHPDLWLPYLRFLYKAMQLINPEAAIECGVYMGVATAHMALGNIGSLVVGIDFDFHKSAVDNTYPYPNIQFVRGSTIDPSTAQKVAVVLGQRRIGLMFLDSMHDGITPSMELGVYRQYFAPECLVVCDDILDPRMAMFWANLAGEKYVLNHLHPRLNGNYPVPGFGVTIWREKHDSAAN